MDVLGPVTGIKSEYRYVLTMLDGYSRFLATHPIPNRRAQMVANAALDMFKREMGVPARLIADRGSEFVATDTRALLERHLGIKMSFIPAGGHQQNLVERTHHTLWGVIRALRLTENAVTWKAAIREALYQYNRTRHSTTDFTQNLLHHGYDEASPGLLHPEGVPANPPPVAPADRIKFTQQMAELKELIRGIVIKNQDDAH